MSTDAPKIEDPRKIELDRTDIGNELIGQLLQQPGADIFKTKLEALPLHDETDATYIAIFPRREQEDINSGSIPNIFIAFIPVRINQLARDAIGIGNNVFHVVGKGMLIEDDSGPTNQANYMVKLNGIPRVAEELWNKTLSTPIKLS